MPKPTITSADIPQKVVIPDDINGAFQSSPNLSRLRSLAQIEIFDSRASGDNELIGRIRDASVILTFRSAFTKFPKAALDGASDLACFHLDLIAGHAPFEE
jgi:hypothetical protein